MTPELCAEPQHQPRPARARGGMVVSVSPHASRIGRDVLQRGGNAVDAAVATAFALAVTWPEAGNIGGGGFMMVHPADGQPPACIEYRETAPGRATRDMYTAKSSRFHHLAVGVPGTVRGLELAQRRFGKLPWRDLVEPAARLADKGFKVDEALAGSINRALQQPTVRDNPQFAELRRVYGRPANEPWRSGQILKLPDLSATLTLIAKGGADAFYLGPIADLLDKEMRAGGGLINKDDLRRYHANMRKPIHGVYRGFDVYGAPPPSSGGVSCVLALNILETFDLRQHDRYSARNLHLITEAMRRAFCDRARHLGDPLYSRIPTRLTSKSYARELAALISNRRATPSEQLAPDIKLTVEKESTTHFSVIDGAGMAVANTYTLEGSWGSRVVVRGAGFVLNNEMGDFNWLPGVSNRRGRIGTKANLIAPHKRMLSSQAPTIVAKNGRVRFATGSPGGRTIINTVLGVMLNSIEFKMSPADSIGSPRMHHQWLPDRLYIEQTDDPRVAAAIDSLREMGHEVARRPRQGSAHSIWIDPKTGEQIGVADQRRGGLAAGVK